MSRAIHRIVARAAVCVALLAGMLPPVAIAPAGAADGFLGAEIGLAPLEDACLDWSGPWGAAGPLPMYWASPPGFADAVNELPAVAQDATAEGGADGFFQHEIATSPALRPCGAVAGWPLAEVPAWTPFGGTALDDGDAGSTAGGVVWVGAQPSPGFWPGWPGIGATTPGGVIDNRLASPRDGDDDDDGDGDGIVFANSTVFSSRNGDSISIPSALPIF